MSYLKKQQETKWPTRDAEDARPCYRVDGEEAEDTGIVARHKYSHFEKYLEM